jgi:hypothetical protein
MKVYAPAEKSPAPVPAGFGIFHIFAGFYFLWRPLVSRAQAGLFKTSVFWEKPGSRRRIDARSREAAFG